MNLKNLILTDSITLILSFLKEKRNKTFFNNAFFNKASNYQKKKQYDNVYKKLKTIKKHTTDKKIIQKTIKTNF